MPMVNENHLFLCETDLLGSYQSVVTSTERSMIDVYLILILSLVEVALGRGSLSYGAAIGHP